MKRFEDYFVKEIDYPENICVDILPLNTLWNFISSTFLDSFINYLDIIHVLVVGDVSAQELDNFNKKFNTELGFFGENVSVLGKIKENMYMYFYFDMDVSDCEIGRFITNDDEETVLKNFRKNMHELHTTEGFTTIPTEYISGWISFLK